MGILGFEYLYTSVNLMVCTTLSLSNKDYKYFGVLKFNKITEKEMKRVTEDGIYSMTKVGIKSKQLIRG